MNSFSRRSMTAFAVVALLALASFGTTSTARALCANVTINNNTGCILNLTIVNDLNSFTISGIIPGTGSYPAPPFPPLNILTALGNLVGFPAAGTCTPCVTLQVSGAPTTCCVQVCNSGLCTLVLNPLVPCPPTCL